MVIRYLCWRNCVPWERSSIVLWITLIILSCKDDDDDWWLRSHKSLQNSCTLFSRNKNRESKHCDYKHFFSYSCFRPAAWLVCYKRRRLVWGWATKRGWLGHFRKNHFAFEVCANYWIPWVLRGGGGACCCSEGNFCKTTALVWIRNTTDGGHGKNPVFISTYVGGRDW